MYIEISLEKSTRKKKELNKEIKKILSFYLYILTI